LFEMVRKSDRKARRVEVLLYEPKGSEGMDEGQGWRWRDHLPIKKPSAGPTELGYDDLKRGRSVRLLRGKTGMSSIEIYFPRDRANWGALVGAENLRRRVIQLASTPPQGSEYSTRGDQIISCRNPYFGGKKKVPLPLAGAKITR